MYVHGISHLTTVHSIVECTHDPFLGIQNCEGVYDEMIQFGSTKQLQKLHDTW